MDEIINDLFEIDQYIDQHIEIMTEADANKILSHTNEIKNQISEIKKIMSDNTNPDNKFEKCITTEKAICNIIFPYYWIVSNLAAEIDDAEQLDMFVENMKSYTLKMIN